VVNWQTVGQMGQEKLYGLYWLLISGGLWIERHWERWEKRKCMVCTEYWLVVGGELRDRRTEGTRETLWFVLITDLWWVVNWKIVGQTRKEKLYGLYKLLISGGWWTERQWDRWDKRNWMVCIYYLLELCGELIDSGRDGRRETVWFVLITE
jgi:hypothetical protein